MLDVTAIGEKGDQHTPPSIYLSLVKQVLPFELVAQLMGSITITGIQTKAVLALGQRAGAGVVHVRP